MQHQQLKPSYACTYKQEQLLFAYPNTSSAVCRGLPVSSEDRYLDKKELISDQWKITKLYHQS